MDLLILRLVVVTLVYRNVVGQSVAICDGIQDLIDLTNTYKTKSMQDLVKNLNDIYKVILGEINTDNTLTPAEKNSLKAILKSLKSMPKQVKLIQKGITAMNSGSPRVKSKYMELDSNNYVRIFGDNLIRQADVFLSLFDSLTWEQKRSQINTLSSLGKRWGKDIASALKKLDDGSEKTTMTSLNKIFKPFNKQMLKVSRTLSKIESMFKSLLKKANDFKDDYECDNAALDTTTVQPTTPRTTRRPTTQRPTTPRPTTSRPTTPRRTTPRPTAARRTTPRPTATTKQGPLGCPVNFDPVCSETTSGPRCSCRCATCDLGDTVECRVWGASHYITFDNHTYDVQTGCFQTLARLYDEQGHTILKVIAHLATGDFEFAGDPEWPGYVSYINSVEFHLGKHMYSINRDRQVYDSLTDEDVIFPYFAYFDESDIVESDEVRWEIFIEEDTDTVIITILPVGFQLSFNGRGTGRVHIKIPESSKSYKYVEGMCGDFNGNPDDDFWEEIRNYVNPGRVFAMINGGCEITMADYEGGWNDSCPCPGKDNWDIPWNNPDHEFDAGAFMTARMACNLYDVCFGKKIEHKLFKTRSCVMDIYSAPTLDTKCEARADVAKACGKIMKHCHIEGRCIGTICYNGGWHRRYYDGKKTVCGCICAPGYTGSDCSIKKGEDEGMVMCRGWGDVHYVSFDKKKYDMQGDCKYYLVKPTTKMLKSQLKFSIQAKNKKSHKGATVSTTDYVELHLTKDVFRISQGKLVTWNGKRLNLDGPIQFTDYYTYHLVRIEKVRACLFRGCDQKTDSYADFIQISVPTLRLRLLFDGNQEFHVHLDSEAWGGELEGLCQNLNGDKDDDLMTCGFRKKDVSNLPNYGTLIGNSCQVANHRCKAETNSDTPPMPDATLVAKAREQCNAACDQGQDPPCFDQVCSPDADQRAMIMESCIVDYYHMIDDRCTVLGQVASKCGVPKAAFQCDSVEQACLNGEFTKLPDGRRFCRCQVGFNGVGCSLRDTCGCGDGGVCNCEADSCQCECHPLFTGPTCNERKELPFHPHDSSRNVDGRWCEIVGEPHYRTFDGANFDFQGHCLYMMSEDILPDDGDYDHYFTISVRNAMRSEFGGNGVTWPTYIVIRVLNKVDIFIGEMQDENSLDVRIVNIRDQEITQITNLPHSEPIGSKDYIPYTAEITKSGETVTAEILPLALKVQFQSNYEARIYLDEHWKGKVKGMCGNYNGVVDDDYVTKTGLRVKTRDNKGTLIGTSWKNTESLPLYDEDSDDCIDNSLPDMPIFDEINQALFDEASEHCRDLCPDILEFRYSACVADYFTTQSEKRMQCKVLLNTLDSTTCTDIPVECEQYASPNRR
ncbi:unnamed protein product [Owenia fusiformis]|uniref:VWFD domain-containing protein n=1 Tax=Owenia fusiformis TaxID=6347 RepID=A0A8S4NHG0_OWEFU|nr:unnamed protein product [Owenia fusiformis]